MLRTVYDALCGTRRNRILLGLAAAILPLLVILVLLEISYREQEATRELSLTVTGSLPSSTTVGSPKRQFNTDHPRWTPLSGPIVPFAPPAPVAVAPPAPIEPTPKLTQRAAVSAVPLPRSRPNWF